MDSNIQNIITLINNFETYYEMSDDNRVFTRGENEKERIKFLINSLSKIDYFNILKLLNDNGKLNFSRYFKK